MNRLYIDWPLTLAIVLVVIVITIMIIASLPVDANEHAMNTCFEGGGIPLMESKDSNVMQECLHK